MTPERVYLSAPDIGSLEEEYLIAALRSGWVAPTGPHLDAFERAVAVRCGVPDAVAVSSGTAALHLALLSLGVGPGQRVIVPTFTFAATANAVVYTGAEPVFVDCDPATGNLSPELLADALATLQREGQPVGAVIPVDMYGRCADYAQLLPICAGHDVPVVADATEALGATYRGRPAGSFGRVAALSFNGNKIITTSGGGMVLSADPAITAYCRYLANQARQPVPHYEHADIGYNYRLSNLLAALGRAQLHRIDGMMARRRGLRERYTELFAAHPGVRILGAGDPEAAGSNCWLTAIVVEPAAAGWTVTELAEHLAEQDIETRSVWKPMHLQPVFAGARAFVDGAAERLFRTGLSLPSGSALGPEQVDRVFAEIERFLAALPTPTGGTSLPAPATGGSLPAPDGSAEPLPAAAGCAEPLPATSGSG